MPMKYSVVREDSLNWAFQAAEANCLARTLGEKRAQMVVGQALMPFAATKVSINTFVQWSALLSSG